MKEKRTFEFLCRVNLILKKKYSIIYQKIRFTFMYTKNYIFLIRMMKKLFLTEIKIFFYIKMIVVPSPLMTHNWKVNVR